MILLITPVACLPGAFLMLCLANISWLLTSNEVSENVETDSDQNQQFFVGAKYFVPLFVAVGLTLIIVPWLVSYFTTDLWVLGASAYVTATIDCAALFYLTAWAFKRCEPV